MSDYHEQQGSRRIPQNSQKRYSFIFEVLKICEIKFKTNSFQNIGYAYAVDMNEMTPSMHMRIGKLYHESYKRTFQEILTENQEVIADMKKSVDGMEKTRNSNQATHKK